MALPESGGCSPLSHTPMYGWILPCIMTANSELIIPAETLLTTDLPNRKTNTAWCCHLIERH